MELAPFVVWGGMGIMAFGTLQGLIAANNARRGRGRGAGKWVYDRSLGGKKVRAAAACACVCLHALIMHAVHCLRTAQPPRGVVGARAPPRPRHCRCPSPRPRPHLRAPPPRPQVWVPDYEAGAGAGSGAPAARLSDLELERVASLAAAAAAAPPEGALQREFSLPAWWNPGPRFVADPSVQARAQRDCRAAAAACVRCAALGHSPPPDLRARAPAAPQASRTAAAERLLARIESSKLKGSDYDVADIVELRRLCQVRRRAVAVARRPGPVRPS